MYILKILHNWIFDLPLEALQIFEISIKIIANFLFLQLYSESIPSAGKPKNTVCLTMVGIKFTTCAVQCWPKALPTVLGPGCLDRFKYLFQSSIYCTCSSLDINTISKSVFNFIWIIVKHIVFYSVHINSSEWVSWNNKQNILLRYGLNGMIFMMVFVFCIYKKNLCFVRGKDVGGVTLVYIMQLNQVIELMASTTEANQKWRGWIEEKSPVYICSIWDTVKISS